MQRLNKGQDGLRVDPGTTLGLNERSSMSPAFSLASVAAVSPEPAYIAAAAAANVVAGEVGSEFHVELPDGASVSSGSLQLINAFLDRLLFNFLANARSTSLGALRPAVTDILKPRLASQAIANADDELQEYLGEDAEDLDMLEAEDNTEPFDLDVVWKRTRLRCMLYTRLGDMEEEEEEMFLEQNNLLDDGQSESSIQPAVAIFLTSVLEFIGEHALMIAAQAAYKRHETKTRLENVGFHKITVEEVDMEKNATNKILGRLWRSWRTAVRSPKGSISRGGFPSRAYLNMSLSSKSSLTLDTPQAGDLETITPVEEIAEEPSPTTIPLPISLYDIDEIEVPGFSSEYAQRSRTARDRPESMFIQPTVYAFEESEIQTETFHPNEKLDDKKESPDNADDEESEFEEATPKMPIVATFQRTRASSLPIRATPIFITISDTASESSFSTPLEEMAQYSDLNVQSGPIIDMSGNTAEVMEDYAIPKSPTSPTSPYSASMLNAISASAAQGFAGRSFYHEEDPADGALQFARDDYEVGEHEYSVSGSRTSTLEPKKVSQTAYDYPMAVSPLVGPTEADQTGSVSPLEPEFVRDEVSPLEESEDEAKSYMTRKKNDTSFNSGNKNTTPNPTINSIASRGVATGAATTVATVALAAAVHAKESRATKADHRIDHSPPQAGKARQRSRDGPSTQDYAKEENREAFVVPQEFNTTPPGEDIPRTVSEPEARRWRTSEKSIPPASLTPVRESFDIVPPVPTISPDQYSPNRQPVPRKALPSTPPPSNSSQSRQVPKIATNMEPITGQRMVISPASATDVTPGSRASDSSSKGSNINRQALAKTKGRMGSLSSDKRESLPSRTSSDGYKSATHDRFSRSSTSNSDPQRDFEQLINSGETLQYTLTPQNMREIEERGKDPAVAKVSTPVQARARTLSTDQHRASQSAPRQPSPQSMNGLRSNPTTEMPAPASSFVVHAGPTIKRGPQLIAKDARTERTNTSDLKEFFRSTGPESSSQPLPPLPVAKLNGPIPRAPKNRPLMSSHSGSAKSKSKFEPREATVTSREDTAMLAEFFRRGPPGAQPVVNKAGSEDVNRRFRDAPSVASTQDSYATRSVQSSTHSRVGLLESTRAQTNGQPSWNNKMPQVDEPAGPVRKQRRVRDPYAIDSDSEEDEDVGTVKGQEKEESLMDFLRNAEPPSVAQNTPPSIRSSIQSKENVAKSSLKSRFGSTSKRSPQQATINASRAVSSPITPTHSYQTSSPTVNNYSTLQSNSYNGVRGAPPASSPAGNLAESVPRMNKGGVRTARMIARDSRGDNSVRALADFLRETEPPPTQSPLPSVPDKEDSGFSRMFSRRKKGVIV